MLGSPSSGPPFALCLPLYSGCTNSAQDGVVSWGSIYEWPNRDINTARVSTLAYNSEYCRILLHDNTSVQVEKIVKAAVLLLTETDLWHNDFQGNAWGWNLCLLVVCQKSDMSVFQRFKSGMCEMKMGAWSPRGPQQEVKKFGISKSSVLRAIKKHVGWPLGLVEFWLPCILVVANPQDIKCIFSLFAVSKIKHYFLIYIWPLKCQNCHIIYSFITISTLLLAQVMDI